MSSQIKTAGDMRGFLADVLVRIREKRIRPDEAGAIAKVAAEINRSLAVEIQTALASGVKEPVVGGMLITSPVVVSGTPVDDTQAVIGAPAGPSECRTSEPSDLPDIGQQPQNMRELPISALEAEDWSEPLGNSEELPPTEPPKNIARSIQADPIDAAKVKPARPIHLEDATANFARNRVAGDKTWCEQCDMSVTTSQAVSCKSKFCKAKDAA